MEVLGAVTARAVCQWERRAAKMRLWEKMTPGERWVVGVAVTVVMWLVLERLWSGEWLTSSQLLIDFIIFELWRG